MKMQRKLISSGLVADFSDPNFLEYKEPENIPIFYIDSKLDELFENRSGLLEPTDVSLNFHW